MTDILINGLYPLDYFKLAGVDAIPHPDSLWWASRQRYASVDTSDSYLAARDGGIPTTEYLDIDLGQVRTVNYINLDVIRAPLNMQVYYDLISDAARDTQWAPAASVDGQPYDTHIVFDGNNRTTWHNADIFVQATQGGPLNTRFLRIAFTRRDDTWPLDSSAPFQWPILVKHLRVGRAITGAEDSHGVLLSADPSDASSVDISQQVRQQFALSDSAIRGGTVVPQVTGFSVLVETPASTDEDITLPTSSLSWELLDVTDPAEPISLQGGQVSGAPAPGKTWIDIYLDPADFITDTLIGQ